MKLADWLRAEALSQAEFAQRIGVTEATVSRWIAGKRRPQVDLIELVRKATRGKVAFKDWVTRQSEPTG